jgi:hypothetical protein
MTNSALTALADALAKRPAEEILFEWFRSGRLVSELRPDEAPTSRRASKDRSRLLRASGETPEKDLVTRQRKAIDCGKPDTETNSATRR